MWIYLRDPPTTQIFHTFFTDYAWFSLFPFRFLTGFLQWYCEPDRWLQESHTIQEYREIFSKDSDSPVPISYPWRNGILQHLRYRKRYGRHWQWLNIDYGRHCWNVWTKGRVYRKVYSSGHVGACQIIPEENECRFGWGKVYHENTTRRLVP